MNKILISFLSLVMFVNLNTSYSSEINSNYKAEASTANYILPNQVGYIHTLEDLQERLKNLNDLKLDTCDILDTANKLKNNLIKNSINRPNVTNNLSGLGMYLHVATQKHDQEKAQIIRELIHVIELIDNDLEQIGHQ